MSARAGPKLSGRRSWFSAVIETVIDRRTSNRRRAKVDTDGRLNAATSDKGNRPAPEKSNALPTRFGRNVLMNYAAQGASALSALVLTPILLHHLGPSLFGVWVLASSAVAYLELFELGFGGATTKLIAEDASIRPVAALRTLNTTFFVLVPLGVLALLVGVGVAFIFKGLVHVAPHLRTQVTIVVAVLAFGLAVSIPGDTFGGALVGHQRYDLLALSNASLVFCTTGACIGIVETGGGIVGLATATTIISIVFQGVRLFMVSRILPGTRINARLVDKTQKRRTRRLSGWFLVHALLDAVYQTGDVMVVGIVLGLRPAAIYAAGSKLANAAINGLDSMAQVFFPHVSATERNNGSTALAEVAIDGTRVTLVAGLMVSAVFIILAGPAIKAWVGAGYGTSANVLMVLTAGTVLASPVRALSTVLVGTNKLPAMAVIGVAEVTVNLALTVTLALMIGPVGVAVGTVGGILLVRLPGYLFLGCRSIGMPIRTFLGRAVVPNILPSVACSVVLLALRRYASHSIVTLFMVALVGCLTYIVIYLLTGATPGEKDRGLAFVTRPLPRSWRSGLVPAASESHENETEVRLAGHSVGGQDPSVPAGVQRSA